MLHCFAQPCSLLAKLPGDLHRVFLRLSWERHGCVAAFALARSPTASKDSPPHIPLQGLRSWTIHKSWVKHLEGPLPQLPSSKANVEAVLFPAQPDIKLPVTPVYYHAIKRQYPLTAEQKLKQADGSPLVVRITSLLDHQWREGHSEMHTSVHVVKFIEEVFESLEEYSSHKLTCNIMLDSTEHRSAASSKTVWEKLRPDTVVVEQVHSLAWRGQVLCARGRHKNLKRKRRPLDPAHYGEVRFLLAYAAAGSEFQWLWMSAVGKQVSSLCFLWCTVLSASRLGNINYAFCKTVGNQRFP